MKNIKEFFGKIIKNLIFLKKYDIINIEKVRKTNKILAKGDNLFKRTVFVETTR